MILNILFLDQKAIGTISALLSKTKQAHFEALSVYVFGVEAFLILF